MAKKKEETLKKQELYQEQWVDTYFNTNFNGRMTSKFLKPHLTLESAEQDAARMLGNAKVQELIAIKQEQIRLKENVQLSWFIEKLMGIVYDIETNDHTTFDQDGRALNKTDHRAKIEAIKTLAKITGIEQPKKIDITTNGESLNLKDLIQFKNTDEQNNSDK